VTVLSGASRTKRVVEFKDLPKVLLDRRAKIRDFSGIIRRTSSESPAHSFRILNDSHRIQGGSTITQLRLADT
jgi:hypothetical protein